MTTDPATGTQTTAARHHLAAPKAWLAVLVLAALVGTLAILKVVGSTTPATTQRTEASGAVLSELTTIPAAVFDDVGVTSPLVPTAAPTVLDARRVTSRPVVLFLGAEYCSFCATERWALIAALGRFGTFSSLEEMASSSTAFAPDTPTFTFYGSRYTSRYVTFHPYEVASDVLAGDRYRSLMTVPGSVLAAARREDPTLTYPLVEVGTDVVARDAAFSPMTLVGHSRDDVAAALVDPSDPVTQAIIASANYLTASICLADGERPVAVCGSRGVEVADVALGLAIHAR